jgi:methionine-rich copper-binding protein CopC
MHTTTSRFVRRMAPAVWCTLAACGGSSSHHGPAAPTVAAVSSTQPADASTGVATNRKITVSFNREMDATSISATTFLVTAPGGVPVLGAVDYSAADRIAAFTPIGTLAPNTTFTATLTTSITDSTSVHLARYVWSFVTGATADSTPPGVLTTVPADAATAIATNHKVVVTFDEPIDPATVSTLSFTLAAPGPIPVSGTTTTAGPTISFTPDAVLTGATVYTATVTSGVADLAGNPLGTDRVFSFTTGAAADTTAPTVVSTSPSDAATAVAVNGRVCATFSEPIDPATLTNVVVQLTGPGGATETGTVAIGSSSNLLCFVPRTDLAGKTTYTAVVTTDVRDLGGNALAAPFTFTFTTRETRDDTTPFVAMRSPDDGTINVAVNQKIVVNFSEAVDPASLNAATFTLETPTTSLPGTIATVGGTAVFTPDADLPVATLVTATLTTGVTDLAGNALALPVAWSFTTGGGADTIPPVVVTTNPADTATAVAIDQSINATFDEPIDPATLTTDSFTVAAPGPVAVTGTVSLDATDTIATFVPDANLPANTILTATLTTTVADLAGNLLAADFVWTFTTDAHTGVTPVDLASAATFAVMATDTTTEAGTATINGDVALGPGTGQGILPGDVNGSIHVADEVVAHAQADLSLAYTDAAGRILNAKPLAADLTGLTLTPGLYKNLSDVTISSGSVTLDAQGDVNAVFLLQVGGALTTGASTQVLLANGARATNVFWQVGADATLASATTFEGSVLAAQSITVNAGSTVDGRLFSGSLGATASVAVDTSVVTVPVQ